MRRNRRTPLSGKPKEDVTVLIVEEFGFRHYLWQPDMTPQALVRWWRNQERPPSPYTDFPGWMSPIYPLDHRAEKGKLTTEDMARGLFRIGSPEKGWADFSVPEDTWYLHTHADDDSVLLSPGWKDHDYTRYFHRGHTREGE
jgi:hypothetical protein